MAVVLFSHSSYPLKKKEQLTPHLKLMVPGFQGLLANILNSLFSTHSLLHADGEISTERFWRLSSSQWAALFCGQEWDLCYGMCWLCQAAFSLQVETRTSFGVCFLFQAVLGTKCCCYNCVSASL